MSARQAGAIADTLILVEHPEVITLGRSAKPGNVLDAGEIPVVPVERGGDVTLHGPGQLVAYPVFLLREGERDLHRYLRGLEEAIIRTVADFGLPGLRVAGRTGVWARVSAQVYNDDEDIERLATALDHLAPPAAPRKLASIGVAVRKWVTLHGLALNVNTDLDRFAAINPCGFPAGVMTSMARELGQPVDLARVKEALATHLGQVFQRAWRETVDSPQ